MKIRETYATVAAAFAAAFGALALVLAAHANFANDRPQASVSILDALPLERGAIAFGLDGAGSSPRRYRLEGATPLVISGWAYDRRMQAPFLGGAIFIDGRPRRLVYGTKREDVALHAASPSLVATGWYVRIPSRLAPGTHRVTFAFVRRDGSRVDAASDVATIVKGAAVGVR